MFLFLTFLYYIVKFGVTARVPIRCMSTSPISSQTTSEDQVQRVKLLTSTDDNYGGVIVELDQLMDSTTFVSILRASILHWKQLVVFNNSFLLTNIIL
jgi:hypothetical protein